jgi:hypothetical protein
MLDWAELIASLKGAFHQPMLVGLGPWAPGDVAGLKGHCLTSWGCENTVTSVTPTAMGFGKMEVDLGRGHADPGLWDTKKKTSRNLIDDNDSVDPILC